ncbi:MAG: class I SAM-dependent methyltransferase [Proteobacteria bacterium]|nr:class I SAM-dependent methyltransferase [Pseudomonadota bacterium]
MKVAPKYPDYRDYVIKDGNFVGDFEGMYRDHEFPFDQLRREKWGSEKAVALNLLRRLGARNGVRRVVEVGCGLGMFTDAIASSGFMATGIDISETAIARARQLYTAADFVAADVLDFDQLRRLQPETLVMAEISWYILDRLDELIAFMRTELPECFIIHLLAVYPPGVQEYGRGYFTDLDGILRYFKMNTLESGEVRLPDGRRRTWFLGSWQEVAYQSFT